MRSKLAAAVQYVSMCCLLLLVLACRLYSDLSVRRAVSRALCLGSVVLEVGLAFYSESHFPRASALPPRP